MKLTCTINNDESVTLELHGQRTMIEGKEVNYQLLKRKADEFQLLIGADAYDIRVLAVEGSHVWLLIDDYEVKIETRNELDLMMVKLGVDDRSMAGNAEILAPMPGTILDIIVAPGQMVKSGDSLLVLNAMKMENVIKSPGDGQVDQVLVSTGDNVNKNQVLVSFKA